MKQHARPPRRTLHVAGETLTLAELALAIASGIALAGLAWVGVVFAVAWLG